MGLIPVSPTRQRITKPNRWNLGEYGIMKTMNSGICNARDLVTSIKTLNLNAEMIARGRTQASIQTQLNLGV